jgi:ABC-2 type transport system ATP-binding protein
MEHMKGSLINTHELSKSFNETRALDKLTFNVKPGQIVGLLGPNGAGKTTAIHIILGLITPSSGAVEVLEKSPLTERHEIAKQVNFSSAYGALPTNLTVEESLFIFGELYGVKNLKQKTNELLDLFEIGWLKNRLVGALSSGEKTRLNLTKCLLNDPLLLILDEPTASLDPDISDKVRKTLKKIQTERNMGILYTSHNMNEVETLCDEIIFIHKGKTIAQGTPEKIRNHFSTASLEQAFIRMVRNGDLIERNQNA